MWDVGWLQQCVGDEEPHGTEETGDENETVECRDDVGFDASLCSTPGHAFCSNHPYNQKSNSKQKIQNIF